MLLNSRPFLSALQLSQGIDLVAMAAEKRRVGCPGDKSVSGLQLADVALTTGTGNVLCDVLTPFNRPFVPALMRQAVFHTLHGLSHPGIRASQKLLKEQGGQSLGKVMLSAEQGAAPQKSPPGTFPSPDAPFSHVHLDVTDTSIKAFVSRWIAVFGAPSTLTTDRGARFESALFQALRNFLGCTHIRTPAYHTAANGMVERLQRHLKTALRASDAPTNWSDNILLVPQVLIVYLIIKC
ncbi:unnamed protein product [Schistocephalus solidus]|uniref:Integrase catalytic domain-containing protein n=1 Tax=Schistocephalus solidus TaxID=70667 RepID=A0A183SB00_SCHSO|nr:unnamed protein product [Schistocephalus solidus]